VMKILQVVPAYFPAISIGGPIYSSLALARLLGGRHAVHAITTQLGLSAADRKMVIYDRMGRSACGGLLLYKKYYGYPNFTFSPSTAVWLSKEIANYDLAILHGIWNFPVVAAAHGCQQHCVPYVVFPHGTLLPERVRMRSTLAKHLMRQLCVQRMLEQAARVAYTSRYEERKTEEYVGSKPTGFVIPNVVDSAGFAGLPERGRFRLRYGIPATSQVLIHYGRIARVKGIELALKAVAALRRQGRDVILAIVGGDEAGYQTQVQAAVAELHLGSAVVFAGLLEREDAKSALVDADVFVLPSYSENFAMAAVEAMLCGLPVVVSDNVGIADELAHADVGVVVALDPDASLLTKALADLLDNKERRASLAKRGRQFAIESYDSPAVAERAEELVRVAVNGTVVRRNSDGKSP
jgi:glycosyltransferase involved in cell wall biosynthesis